MTTRPTYAFSGPGFDTENDVAYSRIIFQVPLLRTRDMSDLFRFHVMCDASDTEYNYCQYLYRNAWKNHSSMAVLSSLDIEHPACQKGHRLVGLRIGPARQLKLLEGPKRPGRLRISSSRLERGKTNESVCRWG